MTTKPSSHKATAKPASNITKAVASEFKSDKKRKKEKKEPGKLKVVRDSFTMPQADYDLIAALKEKALKAGLHVKKSELLRAGLIALDKLGAAQLKRAMTGLEKIKTGRPKKG
jgi:hypothetical protein